MKSFKMTVAITTTLIAVLFGYYIYQIYNTPSQKKFVIEPPCSIGYSIENAGNTHSESCQEIK
jgi:hypothetical protein